MGDFNPAGRGAAPFENAALSGPGQGRVGIWKGEARLCLPFRFHIPRIDLVNDVSPKALGVNLFQI